MSEIIDDSPELDEPFTRYSTIVTYPANASHRFAGRTVRLRGDTTLALAEKRREWHLNNGATSAVIEGQTWVPSNWDQV